MPNAGRRRAQETVGADLSENFSRFKREAESLGLKGAAIADYVEKKEEREREREEKEREREREEREREEKREEMEREREEREREREFQLESKKIEAHKEISIHESSSRASQQTHDVTSKVKLPFLDDKDDVEMYLAQFEKVAKLNNWHEDEWGTRLAPLLRGKSREAFVKLSVEESSEYGAIKRALLHKFQLNAISYRKKFRSAKRDSAERSNELWERLTLWLDRWIELSGKTHDDLGDMLVLEKFLEALPFDEAHFVRERNPKNGREAVEAADLFEDIVAAERRNKDVPRPSQRGSENRNGSNLTLRSNPRENGSSVKEQTSFAERRSLKCFTCGGPHMARYCRKSQPRERTAAVLTTIASVNSESKQPQSLCERCREIEFDPQCTASVEGEATIALRDTGATMSVVNKKLVPKRCYTGVMREVSLASSKVKKTLPTAMVKMKTPYFTGETEVLVMEQPVYPVLIGNVRKTADNREHKVPIYAQEEVTAAVTTRTQEKAEKKFIPLKVPQSTLGAITPETLKREQGQDETLAKMMKIAKDGDQGIETAKGSLSKYVLKEGILYRSVVTHGKHYDQVAVPMKYREEVMRVAHDVPILGHLGVRKTRDRVHADFYWPGIYGDVRRYCASCNVCTKGQPKERPFQKTLFIGTCRLARENLKRASDRYAVSYNEKAKVRKLRAGAKGIQ